MPCHAAPVQHQAPPVSCVLALRRRAAEQVYPECVLQSISHSSQQSLQPDIQASKLRLGPSREIGRLARHPGYRGLWYGRRSALVCNVTAGGNYYVLAGPCIPSSAEDGSVSVQLHVSQRGHWR